MHWFIREKFIGNLHSTSTNTLIAAGTTLNIVAHEDDDLLFLNPDLLHAIQAGRKVRTLFLTAGDSGMGAEHWRNRELGAQAAYAQMCGVDNSWTQTDVGIAEHPIPVFTLSSYPAVSLVFMRLPDGNINGTGFASTHYQSLQSLWTSSISTIDAIDGSSSYNQVTLLSTLTSLISLFQPDQINTQDYVGSYGDGDHSDHHSVAYLVQAAVQHYTNPFSFIGYEGYTTSHRLTNVTGTNLIAKQDAFYAYAYYDMFVGGVPKIFPNSWRMSVKFRRFVCLLHSLRIYTSCLLKSVTYSFLYRSVAPRLDGTYWNWLRHQYRVSSTLVEANHQ